MYASFNLIINLFAFAKSVFSFDDEFRTLRKKIEVWKFNFYKNWSNLSVVVFRIYFFLLNNVPEIRQKGWYETMKKTSEKRSVSKKIEWKFHNCNKRVYIPLKLLLLYNIDASFKICEAHSSRMQIVHKTRVNVGNMKIDNVSLELRSSENFSVWAWYTLLKCSFYWIFIRVHELYLLWLLLW